MVKRASPSTRRTRDGAATVVSAPAPATLFPKALLHTSTVAHLVTSKFALGVPHYRLERDLLDQGMRLDRGLMSRYVEHAGNTLGATVVAAMWRDAVAHGQMISTDATGASIQPTKAKDGKSLACKKGHFFTAVVDADAVLFAYVERHTSEAVKALFGEFRGLLQADASSVYEGPGPRSPTRHRRRRRARRVLGALPALLLRGGAVPAPRWRPGPDADPCHVRGGRRRTSPAAGRARRVPRHPPASADGRVLRVGGRGARPHARAQPRDQGARLRAQPGGRAAPRPGRRRHPLDNTRAERALRKIVVGRKNWLFYGTDTHAEAAASLFSLIATCRLHALDPFVYLDEVLRVLPSWPRERYLELAPQRWSTTRARLDPAELERPVAHIAAPGPAPAVAASDPPPPAVPLGG
ncbi:MAG: transposase [Kofleriaceae bacterium]|nr:transposase [Kofleriaceae bacterium]